MDEAEFDSVTESPEDSVCTDLRLPFIVHCSLLVAMCIILTLAFLEKRNRMCANCCDGRPGVVIPINLLDDFENRWSYACSFGAMINAIATLFAAPKAYEHVDQTYTKVFLSLLYATEVCVAYFPFFACLVTQYKFLGAILGALYTMSWFIVMLFMTIECTASEETSFPILALHVPTLMFLAVVFVKFITVIYQSWKTKEYLKDPKPDDEVCAPFQLQFVKYAMNRNKNTEDPTEPSGWKEKLNVFVATYIWERMPHFMFSTRIVCTMFVATLVTYELGLAAFVLNSVLFGQLKQASDSLYNRTGWSSNVTDVVELYTKLTEAGIFIVSFVAAAIVILDVLIILSKYRSNLIQLYRGDYSFIPKDYEFSSAEIMRFSMVFPGYQIAYKIWGMVIMIIVLFFGITIVNFFIVFSLSFDAVTVIATLSALVIIPGVVSIGLRYSQQGLCYWFFLQDKVNEDDLRKPLALKNRRLYHITNYFFFIANIPIGLFSSLLRIGRSFLWGVIFLGRLDRCVLPPGFETQDKGHMSYLGMLLLEHTHNNPILRVFCQHLLWSRHNTQAFANVIYSSHEEIQRNVTEMGDFARYHGSGGISKAKIRWLLYITLVNNPDLIALRKHHLILTEPQVSTGDTASNTKNKIFQLLSTGVRGVLGVSKQTPVTASSNPKMTADVQAIVASHHQERQKAALDVNSVDHSGNVSETSSATFQRSATINDPEPIYNFTKT